jgi:hypothetical protein
MAAERAGPVVVQSHPSAVSVDITLAFAGDAHFGRRVAWL